MLFLESSWDMSLNSPAWRQSTTSQSSSTWQPSVNQGSPAAAWMPAGAYNHGSGAGGATPLLRLPAASSAEVLNASSACQESTSSSLRHLG